jgi:integrase
MEDRMKWHKTKFSGVRHREHPSRKHGLKKDLYFTIRYQADGKRREEGLGWSSGGWTAEKAALELAKLKAAHTIGEGPTRLNEKREIKQARQKREEQDKLTFAQFFEQRYFPVAKLTKKPETYRKEMEHFTNWINPGIGDLPLRQVHPLNIEKLKKTVLDAGKAPRTLQYIFATIRQTWNMARRDGLIERESPTKQVKLPRIDNQRLRYLTHGEADALLDHLRIRSPQVHNMALLSLHCGLRAGEIFNLIWGDVDLDKGTLILRDTKAGRTRVAFMTDEVGAMLNELKRGKHSTLVFPDKKGNRITKPSKTFDRAVSELGLNDGITDRRQRVVFHTLRHTFASWLVENGTDLYPVKLLLGHSTMSMTERYSHLRQDTLQRVIKNLQQKIKRARGEKKVTSISKGEWSE